MKSKSKRFDIFAGVYFYNDQFVFVKQVKGIHIAKTKDGVQFRPFDVVTKGRRINTDKKTEEAVN